MKRENLKEAQTIINRITRFEEMIKWYERFSVVENSPYSVFVNLIKLVCGKKKRAELEVAYNYDTDYSIGLSDEQQKELIELVNKWLMEDKKKLEEL